MLACTPSTNVLMRLLAGVAVGWALAPVAVSADVGTGVGASPISLDRPAVAGQTYTLPSLYVVNTGSEASYYAVRVERLSKAAARLVPSSWITFGKNDFPLAPKAATQVPLRLAVPANAATGSYMTNLVVTTVASNQKAGVALGAGAAATLTFAVAAPTGLNLGIPWPWPWWVYGLGALLLLGAAVALVPRWFGVRVQVERRR